MELKKEKMLFEIELIINQYISVEQMIKDMFSKLKINYLENKKNELKIQVLNFDGPPIEEGKLMKSVEEIIKEIEKIKKEGCQDLLDVI